MSEQRKQILYNCAAFLFLFAVSLYRQISLRLWPGDPYRTYILYACYVLLIGAWIFSIRLRFTQRSMRFFLQLEALVMFAGLTIRFMQDTFWYDDLPLMRVSGLYVAATLLPIYLLGFYATLGTGQPDNYRIPRKWYLLTIPVVFVTLMIVTDETYHLVFSHKPGENVNLVFRPGITVLFLCIAGAVLMIARVYILFRRNRTFRDKRYMRILVPFMEPILIFAVTFTYFATALNLIPRLAGKEVIELFARIYYVEVLTWEINIAARLVMVNTAYRETFENTTVGMQIIDDEGFTLRSGRAIPVTDEILDQLRKTQRVMLDPGTEMQMYRLSDGYFLWNKDVSLLQDTISELRNTAYDLSQEGVLLEEELRTGNQEARLNAKNRLYDELTGEVADQLSLMKQIVQNSDRQADHRASLCRLNLLGTYVKRRCNLRLIQKESGMIYADDLLMTVRDIVQAMKTAGMQAALRWDCEKKYTSEYPFRVCDTLEYLIENGFTENAVTEIAVGNKKTVITILQRDGDTVTFSEREYIGAQRKDCVISGTEGGFQVIIPEGGNDDV